MAQLMFTQIEFKLSRLINYLNKNVVPIKVRARSMSEALEKAEIIMWR